MTQQQIKERLVALKDSLVRTQQYAAAKEVRDLERELADDTSVQCGDTITVTISHHGLVQSVSVPPDFPSGQEAEVYDSFVSMMSRIWSRKRVAECIIELAEELKKEQA